jgi:hypothetical protein
MKGSIVAGGSYIFAGSVRKEESNANHFDHGKRFGSAALLGKVGCMIDDANWYQLDAVGCWISF